MPVGTDAGWIAHFADRRDPAEPPRTAWQRELAEFNEELRSQFALSSGDRRILGAQVRDMVAAHFGLTRAEIAGGCRKTRYVLARQVAIYMCVRFAGLSHAQAGALFDRDRTTAAHAAERIASRIVADPALAKEIDALVAACRSPAHGHSIPARKRSP